MRQIIHSLVLCVPLLVMAGCHKATSGPKSVDALDKELADSNTSDPAAKAALEDQIMVDPQLAAKSNTHAVRPPDRPYAAPIPADTRATHADASVPKTANQDAQSLAAPGCNLDVAYSAQWATRLPSDLPIYPQGHVSEAAGSETPTCHLRVVSFTTPATVQIVRDFYVSHGNDAGFQVAQSDSVLTGTRSKDGAMFKVMLAPSGDGGTAVDIVSNAGR